MVREVNKPPYDDGGVSEDLLMHFIRSTHAQARIFGKINTFNEGGEIHLSRNEHKSFWQIGANKNISYKLYDDLVSAGVSRGYLRLECSGMLNGSNRMNYSLVLTRTGVIYAARAEEYFNGSLVSVFPNTAKASEVQKKRFALSKKKQ